MTEFTTQEIEKMIAAMSQEPPSKEAKIPVRPPGSYKSLSKILFSPLEGEKPRPLTYLTEKETHSLENIKATVEVYFGKTKMTLKELAALKEGSLLPLDDLCDDLVDIYVNGVKSARGEILEIDGRFGVKIVSFVKHTS